MVDISWDYATRDASFPNRRGVVKRAARGSMRSFFASATRRVSSSTPGGIVPRNRARFREREHPRANPRTVPGDGKLANVPVPKTKVPRNDGCDGAPRGWAEATGCFLVFFFVSYAQSVGGMWKREILHDQKKK